MLHKFAEISLSLSLSLFVCVMSTPSHCYAFILCAFYLPKSKKCYVSEFILGLLLFLDKKNK